MNIRFAEYIQGIVKEKEELTELVDSLGKTIKVRKMEIGPDKTKLNSPEDSEPDIRGNGTKLERVKCFPG